MFSRDEMQRAIEDALKTMEGVALELYRRGREEAREELEEARARNADMRAMLEQVTRERDEARADLARSVAAWESAGMQGRTAHDAMLALAKERDEARAEVERLRETIKLMWSSCGCCKCTACSLAKQAIHPKKAKAK